MRQKKNLGWTPITASDKNQYSSSTPSLCWSMVVAVSYYLGAAAGTGTWRERWMQPNTEWSSKKTCSIVYMTSDWGEGSLFSKTTTWSIQLECLRDTFLNVLEWPRHSPELQRTSLERPKDGSSLMLPIQTDWVWVDPPGLLGYTIQI